VSHRVSSIRNADHILVLDNGSKIEEGSHEELLAKKGVYADMYTKQLLEDAEKGKEED
jgi:ATP-binding cassette subfamily B protein